jgi:excinuclease ABC subunit A
MRVHIPYLVPDPSRSLANGAIIKAALGNDKDSWGGRILARLSAHYGFSLDVPFQELPDSAVDVLFYGSKGKCVKVVIPEGAKQGRQHEGVEITIGGVVNNLERQYRHYQLHGQASGGMEDYFRKMMVAHPCPDCGGGRLKKQRLLVAVNKLNLPQVCELHLDDLRDFLRAISAEERHQQVFDTIKREMLARLDTLIAIGLNYLSLSLSLSLSRTAATLSGGESQRIRLASQIGSGLMGMLYILDEPSIGLHPKDNAKMIASPTCGGCAISATPWPS